MVNTKTDYAYYDASARRWHLTPIRGATVRIRREIVFSWSEFNTNTIEIPDGASWRNATPEEIASMSPLERGHQWTWSVEQRPDGALIVHITMTRVADQELPKISGHSEKFAKQANFAIECTMETWQKISARATKYGVDLISLAVNVSEAQQHYQDARDEWQRLADAHQRAMRLAQDASQDALAELDILVADATRSANRYNSLRSELEAMSANIDKEPGRLPEKAALRAYLVELPREHPLPQILSLSRGAVVDNALVTRMATPRERQAALIAQLLNDFYGKRLAEPRGEAIVLFNDRGRGAGIITQGRLEPYVEAHR
jgi:hypothetical protein